MCSFKIRYIVTTFEQYKISGRKNIYHTAEKIGGVMKYYPGIEISAKANPLDFVYGENVFGPVPEIRTLEDIRKSLENPDCDGPEELYCISMDVGMEKDREEIEKRNLLFGVVTYAKGKIGDGPVRSQGHIHEVSPSCQSSTPEVYEIWEGEAVIYMQESGKDDAGNCYAVHAKAGEVVIVPPYWVHATVNAKPDEQMTFGAWCVRDYGFDYDDVREHNGIAFFPKFKNEKLVWTMNPAYQKANLIEQDARIYEEFSIKTNEPIYTQFQKNKDMFEFVTQPQKYDNIWKNYQP